jgi:hypothetical protein
MRVALGIAAGALVLSGCDWMEKADAEPLTDTRKAALDRIKRACASKLTYARLKEYVFDEAARIGVSDPRRLDPLAAYSVVRMDNPVVKSRDEDLNITVCSGRFVLNLPPGIQDVFDGKPIISADVEYAAQAALDGSGLVYSMNGAEPIIYRIATLGLRARPLPRLAAGPAESDEEVETTLAEISQEAAAVPAAPAPEPKKTVVEAKASKSPASEPVRTAKASASPSFNCRHAKTRSEKLVCGSGSLAAADRKMSAVYYGEMASADPAAKRALRRTRDQFLAKRERCSSESCIARVYEERVAEIRRISGS